MPAEVLPDAVYRDLVLAIFTMRGPIAGLGLLYTLVGSLLYSIWPDPFVALLTLSAAIVTGARVLLITAFFEAGGIAQPITALHVWERRYAKAAYVFALLLAGLAVRSFALPAPVVHMTVLSLVFTFGAGVVSRTAGRPTICVNAVLLAVAPTVIAILFQAYQSAPHLNEMEFHALQAVLLTLVGALSLGSARHQYRSMVEHLTAKHDLGLLARSDPLTGLPNRLLLREAFQPSVRYATETGRPLAVHYLDLDGFKAVNDGFGHPVGDLLLCQVAKRLREVVRSGDTVSRLGGDEFLIIQVGVEHRSEAELLARRIIRELSTPYVLEGFEMRISVSIGIAMAPEFGTDLEQLIACADAALYRSKAEGKSRLNFCSAADTQCSASAAAA